MVARPRNLLGRAERDGGPGAHSCYSYCSGRSAGPVLSPPWWFHLYLVMRARIQDFRVKSITSLHIVVQPAFSGWISGHQVAFRNDRDAHFARGDAGSGPAVDTRSSPPVHRLRRECCWDVSRYVSGNGCASHCSWGPTLSANPVCDHRTNWLGP